MSEPTTPDVPADAGVAKAPAPDGDAPVQPVPVGEGQPGAADALTDPVVAAPGRGDLVTYSSTNPATDELEHGFALVASVGTADDGSSTFDLIPVNRLGYSVPADAVQLA